MKCGGRKGGGCNREDSERKIEEEGREGEVEESRSIGVGKGGERRRREQGKWS